MSRIEIIVNDVMAEPQEAEHGLSLRIETDETVLLFDTGAGKAFAPNFKRLRGDRREISTLVLSHGHYDHTGGLRAVLDRYPDIQLYAAPGIDRNRYSISTDESGAPSVRTISMPDEARRAFFAHPTESRHEIDSFTEVASGIFLTGPIPRSSGETTGGPFFLDGDGKNPDLISDEQALLLADFNNEGTLIQGCCHAGIVNTVEYCRKKRPEISIRTIIGGLHLIHAEEDRLRITANYLKTLPLKRLVLLHCSGENAVAFFREALPFPVETAPFT